MKDKSRRSVESFCGALGRLIPGPLGRVARRVMYGRLLARTGGGAEYAPDVLLRGARSMQFGADVHLGPGASLTAGAGGVGNRILLGDHVRLGKDASIDATGGSNEIDISSGAFIGWAVRLNSSGNSSRISIGERAFLDRGVDIRAHTNGRIEIGPATYLGQYVCMAGPGTLRIGRHCLIASHSSLYAANHGFDDPTRPITEQEVVAKGITIGDDCWLGSGVRVVDGVTIGDGCVIGAGSVVTKSLPPYSIAVGVPARVIRTRSPRDARPTPAPERAED